MTNPKTTQAERDELRTLHKEAEYVGPDGEVKLGAKYQLTLKTSQIAMNILDDLEAAEAEILKLIHDITRAYEIIKSELPENANKNPCPVCRKRDDWQTGENRHSRMKEW